MSTTVQVKTTGAPNTAVKNAPKPPKKNKPKAAKKAASNNKPVKLYVSTPDKFLDISVMEATNSFLFPSLGIHRGQGKAFSQTALANIGGSTILSNATGANNIFAFQVIPALCNNAAWFQAGFGATPAAALANVGAAIISSTQAESYRVVSFQASIIPQGSFTNQAGSGLTGFVPDNLNFTFTAANMANLVIKRPFKGVDSQMLHWLPTENSVQDETQMSSVAASLTGGSTLMGYINIPTASDTVTSFQIDYQIGIEYVPSPAYRPWVDKCSPVQDIRAMSYVNMAAERNWDPVLIGTMAEYSLLEKLHVAQAGGHTKVTSMITHDGVIAQNIGLRSVEGGGKKYGIDKGTVHAVLGALTAGNDFQTGVVNAGLGVFNAIVPGDNYDIPYISTS